MIVIPRDVSGVTSTNGFTIDREYEAERINEYVARVYNDNGHERIVGLDEEPSAHLTRDYVDLMNRPCQRCAGYFEVIEKG